MRKDNQTNQGEQTAYDEAGLHAIELCNESDQEWPRHVAKFLERLCCAHARAESILIHQRADQSVAVSPDRTNSDTGEDNNSEKRNARCECGDQAQ